VSLEIARRILRTVHAYQALKHIEREPSGSAEKQPIQRHARTFVDQQKSNILAKRVTGADVAPNLQFEPMYSANADLLPRPTYPIASRNSVQPCFPQSRDLS
jgi:hypothetical protein